MIYYFLTRCKVHRRDRALLGVLLHGNGSNRGYSHIAHQKQ